jgi:hypothetical protein
MPNTWRIQNAFCVIERSSRKQTIAVRNILAINAGFPHSMRRWSNLITAHSWQNFSCYRLCYVSGAIFAKTVLPDIVTPAA